MKCPNCGLEMELEEKDTSSGRDMRAYLCRPCARRVDVDHGAALWQVLHDARENGPAGHRPPTAENDGSP